MTPPKTTKLSRTYRGLIIEQACIIEAYFDEFLSMYFCTGSPKQKEFVDIILGGNRISFDGKKKIINTILTKAKKDFKTLYPDFNKDMTLFQYERNCFAHYMADTSEEALSKGEWIVGLIKKSANTRTDYYDVERLSGIIGAGSRCIEVLRTLVLNDMFEILALRRLPKIAPKDNNE
jgi:hypothetical protein